jgi:hypothetical protein
MGVTNYLGNLGGEGGGGGSASIAFTYVGNGGPSIVVPIPGALSTPIPCRFEWVPYQCHLGSFFLVAGRRRRPSYICRHF